VKGLNEIIAGEISKDGPISFARFMELALYCPLYGYYEVKKDNVGRAGDFFTSVSVGSLFGEMLAFQFAEWLEPGVRSQRSEVRMAEAGAHDGKLAKDILTWLRLRRPGLFDQSEYVIIEPSARRQEWQRETLREFAPKVRWLTELPAASRLAVGVPPFAGILFSNELLDAFPVRRFGWDARQKKWFEWGVALDGDKFVWAKFQKSEVGGQRSESENQNGEPNSPTSNFQLPTSLLDILPDNFTTEICPAAERWWRDAATFLRNGKLLTFDYGLSAGEFFSPERNDGTVRAYHRHQLCTDLLARPGEQDLTAQVNFTAIQNAGEAAGLKTEAFVPQAKFLTQIAEQIWRRPADFGEWTPAHTRQFQTLTHPQHLGRPFRALVQSRQP
jgi:SAM-dependent MidA family methyltransferase